jgi:hypothetical protein
VSSRLIAAAALAVAWGCGGGSDPPPAPPPVDAAADADPGTPQRPPIGQAALESWLAEGHYLAWTCEDGVFAPRLTGNHGRQKICSNQALLASTAGPYPVGASSVKLLYDSAEAPNGFAVGVKVEEGEGAHTWYWYERRGTSPTMPPLAEGVGVPDCAVCHGTAPRDHVFIRAVPATLPP